jgi:hypothetical protein
MPSCGIAGTPRHAHIGTRPQLTPMSRPAPTARFSLADPTLTSPSGICAAADIVPFGPCHAAIRPFRTRCSRAGFPHGDTVRKRLAAANAQLSMTMVSRRILSIPADVRGIAAETPPIGATCRHSATFPTHVRYALNRNGNPPKCPAAYAFGRCRQDPGASRRGRELSVCRLAQGRLPSSSADECPTPRCAPRRVMADATKNAAKALAGQCPMRRCH